MSVNEKKVSPDLQLLSICIEAILETFNTQCGVTLAHGVPYKAGEKKGVARDAVTVFGIRTREANVSIALMIPEDTYKQILVRLFKDAAAASTEAAVEDGLREIVNIVFNRIKSRMNKHNDSIHRAIPVFGMGKGMKIWYLTVGEVIVVPFYFENFFFDMEVVLELN